MFYTIYQITNIHNGKVYIGKHQTEFLSDKYMGSGLHLRRSIKKHGLENFKKEILFIFENEVEMNEKEAELVDEAFCLREDTYNVCPGGKGGWGYVNSNEETRIVKNKKARIRSNQSESKRKQSSELFKKLHKDGKLKGGWPNWSGKTHSEESKQKMKISQQGKQSGEKNSQFGSLWITNGIESKKIKKEDLIPEGWRKGHSFMKKNYVDVAQ